MIASNVGFYAFPDDDSLAEIIDELAPSDRGRLTWRPVDGSLLQVSPGHRRVLRLILRIAGVYEMAPSLLFVPTNLRPFTDRLFAILGTTGCLWFRLEGVEFESPEARSAFEALL